MPDFDDLTSLSAEEQAELAILQHLSDESLWEIAAEQMPKESQARLSFLLALNKRGLLSNAETTELDTLLANGDLLMLRKAEAAAILTKRGYVVTPNDMSKLNK